MPRQQKIHNNSKMAKAVAEVNRGKSVYKVSRLYGIPQSTLKDHSRGRYRGFTTSFGRSPIITSEEENTLVSYLIYMSERGFPLSKKMVRNLTRELIKVSGRDTLINTQKGPSDKWLQKFFKRHPELSVRHAHSLDRARASVTTDQLDQYYELLDSTLKRLSLQDDPTRIFNCDETGFSGSISSADKSVVVKKGVRQAFKVQLSLSGHITVNYAVSASGQTLPPFVIFSKNLPRASFSEGLPDNWMFETSDSGFINTDLFCKWFEKIFLKSCGKRRPCLLIMDNHVSHVSGRVVNLAIENGIDLLYFPSHSSHLLQPLDVGYFHVLKAKVGEILTGLGYAMSRSLPRHLFPKVLHQAMNRITPATVAASFSATGIYPYNKSSVKTLAGPVSKSKAGQSTPGSQNASNSFEKTQSVSNDVPNMLVKIGMVPESLANIFIEPPMLQPSKKRRTTYDKARVIPSRSIPTSESKSNMNTSVDSHVFQLQ